MRKVTFDINMSIDGCCDHTKLSGTEEIYDYYTNLFQDMDLFVFGRKTYELMYPYWPDVAKNHSGTSKAENDFAQAFDSIENVIVFSRSLARVEGKNTRIVHTSPEDEIRRLKQEPGKEISISGLDLLSQLVDKGLIDEYRFLIQPFLVGDGRRLLDGMNLKEKLKLVEAKSFKSGCVALRYASNQ
jgi:dihydrofolate reductase